VEIAHGILMPSALFFEDVSDTSKVDDNLKTMDKLFHANFHSFIRNEENVLVAARHLYRIAGEYELPQVVNGLRWLIDGWRLDNVAKLLKLITREWSPEATGTVVNLLSHGWQAKSVIGDPRSLRIHVSKDINESLLPDPTSTTDTGKLNTTAVTKLIAILVAGEPPEIAGRFIDNLTLSDDWAIDRTTELVSFLDTVLEWEEPYFHEFMRSYILSDAFRSQGRPSSRPHVHGKISLEYLSVLYKTNLAITRFRLAMADYQVALASRQLGILPRLPVPLASIIMIPPEADADQPSDDSIIGVISAQPLLAPDGSYTEEDARPHAIRDGQSNESSVWSLEQQLVQLELPDSANASGFESMQEDTRVLNMLAQMFRWSVAQRDAPTSSSPIVVDRQASTHSLTKSESRDHLHDGDQSQNL
jgi:hypothetical protein